MPNPDPLASFVSWYQKHITGDEKGQAQIFLNCLFQWFVLGGLLDVGGLRDLVRSWDRRAFRAQLVGTYGLDKR